ncbi:hypothetical protein KFZ76_18165 [Methylovulum psychrotolerans]|uniref:beta strand repeat-containing protein n=1 Tax=Methylovulum psychrotolerans TaxID=1704499 RepID=UPI001BFF86BD|nr:hypothetical protein [Methylovulum psychrotolerans]MBT9099626.1 hypothetical protein [Methylovulum psychrotolerans]
MTNKKTAAMAVSDNLATVATPVYGSAADVPLPTSGVNTAPRFSSSFKVFATTDFGGTDDGRALAIQADGKFVVAGSGNGDFALARYNTDGSLDTNFDGDGKVTTDFTGFQDTINAMVLQTNGKILVAGSSVNGFYRDFALARYNADGSLDTSFDGDGKLTTDFSGDNDSINSLVVQADGKILAAGKSFSNSIFGGYDNFALARYNTDGSLDVSFSGDGKLTTQFSFNASINSVNLQSDGKILVTGDSNAGANTYSDFALARYNADGSLDTSFGGSGKLTTSLSAYHDGINATTLLAGGKILVAGYSNNYSTFALVRYNSNGSLDTSFNGSGTVTTDFSGFQDIVNSITVQADGKILVAGWSYTTATGADFALARYNTDGSLDTSFDGDGKLTTDLSGKNDYGNSVAVQANGQIVVAGNSDGNFALTLYNSDGSLANKSPAGSYVENGAAVKLDNFLQLNDDSLDSLNNYSGATVTLARQGGASSDDVFTLDATGALFTVYQNFLLSNGEIFADFTSSNGVLTLHFSSLGTPATQALVKGVLQHVTYSNTAGVLPAKVLLDWTANDGNTGSQGSGGALSTVYTSTVNMVAVNDAPTGTDKIVNTPVNTAYTVTVNDFGFSDPNDSPANTLNKVIISQLPTVGSLTLLGTAVTVGQAVSVTNITAGLLKFTPATGASGAHYAQIGFKVQDNGGTANGGVDTDTVSRFLTVNVGFSNHAPTGTVTISGLATQGQVLTASNSLADVDGLGPITYTWKSGATVLGTGNTYTLKATDIETKVTATASYTDLAGTAESVISAATVLVGAATTGTANADVLLGSAGNDMLLGAAGNDVLVGDLGDDLLDGGSGIDTLVGGAGNDTYIVDNAADIVAELNKGGTDTVDASVSVTLTLNVENLVLTGTAALNGTGNGSNNDLLGNAAANVLSGGAGNDTINGGAGNDNLTGGTGKDTFIFNSPLTANADTITDFKVVDDTIQLENAVFTQLTATGVLNAANLKIGTGASDANDFIVYNPSTGALFYDADGSGAGAAVQIATVGVNLAMTNADFMVS